MLADNDNEQGAVSSYWGLIYSPPPVETVPYQDYIAAMKVIMGDQIDQIISSGAYDTCPGGPKSTLPSPDGIQYLDKMCASEAYH
jgi:hypothetical protein